MELVESVRDDIRSLKIQGATNVALAVLDTLRDVLTTHPDLSSYELTRIGEQLAFARPTEPLAQNAVRYVGLGSIQEAADRIRQYRLFIEKGKHSIPENGVPVIVDGGQYLTLCHSSTIVHLFEMARAKGAYFSLFVAETRPRFQGRTTAKELLAAGFDDVTMIIDDVAVSLIEGRKGKIDAVFIGADLLTAKGFVNKVGSLAIAAAAKRKKIPVYVLTTLLKYDPGVFTPAMIERRSSLEIWEDAPDGLQFYAPAFDYVPFNRHIHVVTESGILQSGEVPGAVRKLYPFIFEKGYDKRLHYGKSI